MVKQVTQTPTGIINSEYAIDQSNWDDPDHLAVSQLSMHKLFKTVSIENPGPVQALPTSDRMLDIRGMTIADPLMPCRRISGDEFLNRRLYNDALLVMHKGEVVHESYRNGMQETDRHVLHSCTKSLCSMLLAIAVDEGLVDPGSCIGDYITEFRDLEAWQGVTVQQVWDMQAGIAFDEDYENPDADYWSYARAAGYYPPLENERAVGVKAWVFSNLTRRDHPPGKVFTYSSALTIVLGILLENVYGADLADLFEVKLYSRIGAESAGYFNTDPEGFPIVEGQLNLTLRDFARFGLLVANGGTNLSGERVLPKGFVDGMIVPDSNANRAFQAQDTNPIFPTGQYKNQFWVLEPERARIAMIGIHGQFSWCDLKNDLLIVGLGSYPKQDSLLLMNVQHALWQGLSELACK